jgi:Holliday junction DNA helicase RuvA
MITFLKGRLVESTPTHVVVEVGGLGYEVLIPLSSFDKLPATGSEVRLLTHFVVREDAHQLYGFMSSAERDLFRMLVNNVSGIGPKTALAALSGMSVGAFRAAVVSQDVKSLSRIHGVGKKTAERIVVELKDKLGDAAVWEAASEGRSIPAAEQKLVDAVSALVALEFKPAEAHQRVKAALVMLGDAVELDALVRAALKQGA